MKKLRSALLVLMTILCFLPAGASATTLLVNQQNPDTVFGYGYGLSQWAGMTADLNTAFGGAANVTVDPNPLTNLGFLMGFDRLWVTPGISGPALLSPTEISNIQTFIASGRRVALLGENDDWTNWNNSILQTVGGTYSGVFTSDLLTPAIVHPLTQGVNSLFTIADGVADPGGTPVFSENVVTLWGGPQNVVTLLSVNVMDDTYRINNDNAQFSGNLANWLAGTTTSVPEPSSLLLLGMGIAGLGLLRKAKKLFSMHAL